MFINLPLLKTNTILNIFIYTNNTIHNITYKQFDSSVEVALDNDKICDRVNTRADKENMRLNKQKNR